MDTYAVRVFESEEDLEKGNKANSRHIATSTGGKDLTNVLIEQNEKRRRIGVYKVRPLWGFLPFQVESQETLSLQELGQLGIPEFPPVA